MSLANKFKNLIGMESEEDYDYDELEVAEEVEETTPAPRRRSSKVTELPTSKQASRGGKGLLARECRNIEQLEDVLIAIKTNQVVFVNLQRCNESDIQRILDYIGGTIFAVDADLNQIGVHLYLITPKGEDPQVILEEDALVGEPTTAANESMPASRKHESLNGYPI